MAGRTPRAARTLIRQVRESLNRKADSKAGVETAVATDEPDGFGVHRSFKFDKVASKALTPALLNDNRIVDMFESKDGMTVEFTGDTRADDASEFVFEIPDEGTDDTE